MKPLEGITVLEFSTMITASFAAMMMAEQGARVIKVEPTDQGDPMRYIGASKGAISGLFANCNRGKRSIRVDLKQSESQALIAELAADADVVIHNFRPGVMDRLQLGAKTLRERNPRLIYAAISGFGTEGPLRDAPAYDPIIQAHAGFTASQGSDAPVFIRNLMCDKITAYTACQAVTAALYHRERTGDGQIIDVSMLDSGLFFVFPDGFMNHTLLDDDVSPQPLLADLIYDITLTSDGGLTLSAGTEKQRAGVLAAIGREDLKSDQRFATFEQLVANIVEYRSILEAEFQRFTTSELIAKLVEHDVPCARCHSYDEVLNQEQLSANDSITQREHPVMGNMRIVKSPARFGGRRLPPGDHSPDHGQHTEEVLQEFGVSAERIGRLMAMGAIA
jgi:crotonobetainyl-CoA:carnitine CoA-transferase CaiB-like acyl-CoA transferase